MDSKPKFRTAVFYKDYFEKFFIKQSKKVKTKIIWTIELIEELEKVPETYLKHIKSAEGLYEIRFKHSRNIFRIFCFFKQDKLIIILHGFQKKTRKTPKKEIERALKIKEEYENENK